MVVDANYLISVPMSLVNEALIAIPRKNQYHYQLCILGMLIRHVCT